MALRRVGRSAKREVIGVLQVLRHGENKGDALTPAGVAFAFARGKETAAFFRSHPALAAAVAARGVQCIPYHGPQLRQRATNFRVLTGFLSEFKGSASWRASRIHPSLAEVAKTPAGEADYARDHRLLKESATIFARGTGTQPHYSEDVRVFRRRTAVLRYYADTLLALWNAAEPEACAEFLRLPVPFVSVVSSSLHPTKGPVERMALELIGRKKLGRAFKRLEGVRLVFYADGSKEFFVLRQNKDGSFRSPRRLR